MEKMSDLIERQAAIDAFDKQIWGCLNIPVCKEIRNAAKDTIRALPEIVRCKDCKHWKDSDGVYRRGFDAESKCPINIQEVYAGTFYCGYAERREK